MSDSSKVWLGVLGGVLLGAFGSAVVRRGKLGPCTAKVLSYGYDIKDKIVESCEEMKEGYEDIAAEAKEQYEERKESATKKTGRASVKSAR